MACNYAGTFELTACPRQYLDRDTIALVRYADLFRRGIPPIAGGVLDQESWFMDACEFLWCEQDRLAPPPLL